MDVQLVAQISQICIIPLLGMSGYNLKEGYYHGYAINSTDF